MALPSEPRGKNDPPPGWQVALRIAAGFGFFAALVFWPAGRLDWLAGWLHLAAMVGCWGGSLAWVQRRNPALVAHRMRWGKGTKRWDWVWLALFTLLYLAIYVIAGFDAERFGWSAPPVPPWPVVLWLAGLLALLAGVVLVGWAMVVNPFFEKTVRIQHERGHRVIDTGPYRFVRHPGYVGFAGWLASAPLMLGSAWAWLPAGLAIAAVVVRTALEDRTLRAELPGYEGYADRVRWRLVPGIW